VSLDFEILGMAGDNGRQEVLLSAARTESVSGRVSALTEAGMTTMVVDVGAHALGRAVLACLPDLQTSEKPVGIVDIGASALTFAALLRGRSSIPGCRILVVINTARHWPLFTA
jgi:type IV pilus assembly protein PilM